MVLRDVTERMRLETALEQTPRRRPARRSRHSRPSGIQRRRCPTSAPRATAVACRSPAPPGRRRWPGRRRRWRHPRSIPASCARWKLALTRICGQAPARLPGARRRTARGRSAARRHAGASAGHHARLEAAHRERWQIVRPLRGRRLARHLSDRRATGASSTPTPRWRRRSATTRRPAGGGGAPGRSPNPVAWARAVEPWYDATAPRARLETRWKRTDGALAMLRLTGRPAPPTEATRASRSWPKTSPPAGARGPGASRPPVGGRGASHHRHCRGSARARRRYERVGAPGRRTRRDAAPGSRPRPSKRRWRAPPS